MSLPDIQIKQQTQFTKSKSNAGNTIAFIIVLSLLIASVLLNYYWYRKYTLLKVTTTQQQNTGSGTATTEVATLVEKVGKLIALPEDETPTIATIKQPDKLKDQAFFANAKEGDKVLIYTKARKAILYDPSADKIIQVAPFVDGQTGGDLNPQAPSGN